MYVLSAAGCPIPKQARILTFLAVLAGLWILTQLSHAEERWSLEGREILFYTDDVGLFSATRRLSRDGDPTQPTIDSKLTDKGSDMIFEARASSSRRIRNSTTARCGSRLPRPCPLAPARRRGFTMPRTSFSAITKSVSQASNSCRPKESPVTSGLPASFTM